MSTSPASDVGVERLYRFDRLHAPLASPELFGEEHVQQYRREGFIAIENVFSAGECEAAKAGLSHLIALGREQFKHVEYERDVDPDVLPAEQRELHVRKLMWFAAADERLRHMAEHPALLAVVKRLVGSDVTMSQDMALLKPPGGGREKPWHQDTAYFLLAPLDGVIGTWTALDDVTIDNGCMHVIPASHLQGPRPHQHLRDCQLPDGDIDVQRDVVVPLRAGGVLFFSGLLHHGTPPNNSTLRRRALQFHYTSVHCRPITRAEHGELFHSEAGYAGCSPPREESTDG